MIYLINWFYLSYVKALNRFGKGLSLKKTIFSSRNILEGNFSINSNFCFIQVGANDGVSFDFLYDFVIKRKSSGMVIEPVKEYYDELITNYKNFPEIIKVNKAVHPIEKEIIIYKIATHNSDKYPDWVKGIASFDINHHVKLKINSDDIIEEKVDADNLMMIIANNYQNKKNDYFQIDTEGFDYEVLKMINFKVFKPAIIKYESVNLIKEDKRKSELLLKENGYHLFDEFGDTVGINLSKVKLF